MKIEVVNIKHTGFLYENHNEHILASFDIRMPDLQDLIKTDKEINGPSDYLRLPLDETIDYKAMKMKYIPVETGERDE